MFVQDLKKQFYYFFTSFQSKTGQRHSPADLPGAPQACTDCPVRVCSNYPGINSAFGLPLVPTPLPIAHISADIQPQAAASGQLTIHPGHTANPRLSMDKVRRSGPGFQLPQVVSCGSPGSGKWQPHALSLHTIWHDSILREPVLYCNASLLPPDIYTPAPDIIFSGYQHKLLAYRELVVRLRDGTTRCIWYATFCL
jgi:hypothetical protein